MGGVGIGIAGGVIGGVVKVWDGKIGCGEVVMGGVLLGVVFGPAVWGWSSGTENVVYDPYTLDLDIGSTNSTARLLDNPSFLKLKQDMKLVEERFRRKKSFSSHDPNSARKITKEIELSLI